MRFPIKIDEFPTTLVQTDGDEITVYARTANDNLLGIVVSGWGSGPTLHDTYGKSLTLSADIQPQRQPGLAEYHALPQAERDLYRLTFRHNHKITGIKALRGGPNLGEVDSDRRNSREEQVIPAATFIVTTHGGRSKIHASEADGMALHTS